MSLLSYFQREMTYLRTAGAMFAKAHPNMARQLDIEGHTDPHVERLIESFAFLTARIQQEIDQRMPEVARALLGILYPHLERPFPSCSIAEITPAPKLTQGMVVPQHTDLFVPGDIPCRFRTTHDMTLWPVAIQAVNVVTQADMLLACPGGGQPRGAFALKLTLHSPQPDFAGMDHLTIHLNGEDIWHLWADALAYDHNYIVVRNPTMGRVVRINEGIIPDGWDAPLIQAPAFSDAALTLAQDYAHFPKKFASWRLQNLRQAAACFADGGAVDIFIPLRDGRKIAQNKPAPSVFRLGCVPMVNLFPKTSDPIRWDQKKVFYRVVPDQRRDRTTEVYSIEKMMGTREKSGDFELTPYFSVRHHDQDEDGVYWLSKRQQANTRDLPGSDVYVSFVDLKFQFGEPPAPVMYAHTLCTNRFLAEDVPPRATLQSEEALPASSIVCLYKPSAPAYAPTDGTALWQLISQLASHHLSFTQGANALSILRETMTLHGGGYAAQNGLSAVTDIQTRSIVRRRPLERSEAWRGFVEGLEVALTLDDSAPTPLLPALLIRRLLKAHIPIQSFVETVFKDTHDETWLKLSHDWGRISSNA